MTILIINDIRHTDTEITGEHQPSSDLSQKVNHHSGSSWSKWPHGTFDNELIWAKHLCHSETEQLKTEIVNPRADSVIPDLTKSHAQFWNCPRTKSGFFNSLQVTEHVPWKQLIVKGKMCCWTWSCSVFPILYQKRLPHHQKQGTSHVCTYHIFPWESDCLRYLFQNGWKGSITITYL